MKRGIHWLLALGFVVAMIGCGGESKPTDTTDPAATPATDAASTEESTTSTEVTPAATTEESPAAGEFRLVNLNVPNMT